MSCNGSGAAPSVLNGSPPFHLKVVVPTAAAEWFYVRYLVDRSARHRSLGYRVALPHTFVSSRSTSLPLQAPKRFVRTFRRATYRAALDTVQQAITHGDHFLQRFSQTITRSRLRLLPLYTVQLTLYGMGGSYRTAKGIVILKVPSNGQFHRPPLHSIIHEMVHIAIDGTLIDAKSAPHGVKEAVVDAICFRMRLPRYQPQRSADPRLARLLKGRHIASFRAIIHTYLRAG